jgi:hypothetical protein
VGYTALPLGFRLVVFRAFRYPFDMLKALKYHLKPTKKPTLLLAYHLDECRWLYNHLLAERKPRERHVRSR